ncbi:Eco29kI family restriction endonuclease [Sinorhizobium meliloti]|uniref:Eco29kI family restriction endonuclease n=1 Tax=Rhizobium meliloti TaxID=382 RepID=UPI000FD1B8EB|nr:Eco29kI family restriction endonuclease [Sinorhizobium meliloti]RVM09366.1 Eco29kI family restriction endonuclease [Sinorhizobium meliloti]RVM50004.1 Eco29kI family restriction endonuclease [Sinorhizobium meliloti]RVM66787.1 Eco29kI family restriction endonuclease [Sinorhizobium meliloti]RVM72982.1 Eco29kI family restriction endonuclease [Sinorhizobium meliloti]RVM87624.1 Eco29kI family restriction endonuclease [Sinorhizobium meliloti]
MIDRPYNPLDKANLAKSIEFELLGRQPIPLSAAGDMKGAGIYVIYYMGDFPNYAPIAAANAIGAFSRPIYIGKAIPKGGRKGGLSADASKGRALADRLAQHAASIEQASNLRIEDFLVRFLVVDDIWIPLGENILIETFKPLWNRAIDGFGNRDPGRRRATQYRSPWDVLHPGRAFATKLADSPLTDAVLRQRVSDYLSGKPLEKLPKVIEEQQAEEEAEVQQGADGI